MDWPSAARAEDACADVSVSRIGPETTRALRLDFGVSRTPLRVNAKSYQRVAYCSAACMPIELHAIAFGAVHAYVIRREHPFDIRGAIVATVAIDMVTVCSRSVRIDVAANVPLVSQPMRRHEMSIQRLIDHFITASQLPIQRHQ